MNEYRALLTDNIKKMNTFMNKVALQTFSSFDSGNKPSDQTEPERFYHGFVLGMIMNLSNTYRIRSNRESGYGRYDVMMIPLDKNEKVFIFEFKVLDSDENEITLEDTLANAHIQIDEKQYEAELISEGFMPQQIRKYGFAFQRKKMSDWVVPDYLLRNPLRNDNKPPVLHMIRTGRERDKGIAKHGCHASIIQ